MIRRPVHEIRNGLIIAKIYGKKSKGAIKYSVSLIRIFRNRDVWNESNRFGIEDLLAARWIIGEAYTWIHAREERQKS